MVKQRGGSDSQRGDMSVREAGKKGGETRREQLGQQGGNAGGQRERALEKSGREVEGEE